MDQLLFSVSDAAPLLGIGESLLRDLIAAGKITTVRLHRRGDMKIRRRDLEAFIDALPAEREGDSVHYAIPYSRPNRRGQAGLRALPDPDRVEIEHE